MNLINKIVEIANDLGSKAKENPQLLNGVTDLLTKDGITGIIDQLKTKGLGEIASSWVGKGENKPINTDQIKAALGSETLNKLAQKAGVSPENASKFLTEVLPGIIDKLTPEGNIPPTEGADQQQQQQQQ